MRRRGRTSDVGWLAVACFALGCGDAGRSSARVGEPSGAVELLVVDQIGAPVSATPVLVGAAPVTTDERGHATIPDVPASYDVALVVGGKAYAFFGMKSRSALIKLRDSADPERIAYATIELANPSGLGPDERVFLIAGATDPAADGQLVYANVGQDGPSAQPTWLGPSAASVSADALVAELARDRRRVLGFAAYAHQAWRLDPDDYVYWQPTFQAMPFASATIHADTDAETDARGPSFEALLHAPSGATGLGSFATGSSGGVDLPVLEIPGARYDIRATLALPTGTIVAEARDIEPGESAHLTSAAIPEALAPDDQAEIDEQTEFHWAASDEAVYLLTVFTDDDAQPFLQYELASAEPTVKIPDFTSLGVAFPAGRRLTWGIRAERGHASLDSYASGEVSRGWASSEFRLATAAGRP